MNQKLWARILEILRRKLRDRRWQRAITCVAGAVVFATTYALILPAITMTDNHPTLSAEQTLAWTGDGLTVKVSAEAESSGGAKTFVLIADGEGADLSPEYAFNEEGICLITDEEGNEIELHRSIRKEDEAQAGMTAAAVKNAAGKNPKVDYWFTLEAGSRTSFTLDLKDEIDESRFAETVEALKQSTEAEKATESDAGKSETAESKATASNADKTDAAGKAEDEAVKASASNAVKASSSNADVEEANALAKTEEEKIVTEQEDDGGFVEILDGAVIDDLDHSGEEDDGEQTEIVAKLLLSAGIGSDYQDAVDDAEKGADKRGDAQVMFQWKDVIAKKAAEPKLMARVDGATIAVFYDVNAGIPEGAGLTVREIEENSAEYEEYLEQTKTAAAKATGSDARKAVAGARYFDIKIFDAEGVEVEPQGAVKVVITYDEAVSVERDSDLNVVHFKDEEPETIRPASVGEGEEVGGISFTAESFSVYGVYYTVDFHYGVDGKSFGFSIPGGGAVTLSEVVSRLSIDSDMERKDGSESVWEFVNGVDTVSFSSPSLVSISKAEEDTTVGEVKENRKLQIVYSSDLSEEDIKGINETNVKAGDWVLISLMPFSSVETITVTMQDGEVFTVIVKDAMIEPPSLENIKGTGYLIYVEDRWRNRVLVPKINETTAGTDVSLDTVSIRADMMDACPAEYYWIVKDLGWDGDNKDKRRYAVYPASFPQYRLTAVSEEGTWHLSLKEKNGDSQESDFFTISPHVFRYMQWESVTGFTFKPFDGNQGMIMGLSDGNFAVFNEDGAIYNSVDIKLWEPDNRYFTVETNDPDMGLVYGTEYVDGRPHKINEDQAKESYNARSKGRNQGYRNNNTIYTVAKEGYVFDHWELNGTRLILDQNTGVIQPPDDTHPERGVVIPYSGSVLKAVFRGKGQDEGDEYEGRDFNKEELENWLKALDEGTLLRGMDKTAAVYGDEQNRIYKLDLAASSGMSAIKDSIDLAFITDTSNSMLFPASLTSAADGEFIIANFDQFAAENNLRKDTTYYTVGDRSLTSTVFAVFWGPAIEDANLEDGWYAWDASYYAMYRGGTDYATASDNGNRVKRLDDKLARLIVGDTKDTPYRLYLPNQSYEEGTIADLYAKDESKAKNHNRLYYLKKSIKDAVLAAKTISEKHAGGAISVGLETFNQAPQKKNEGNFWEIGGTGTKEQYDSNYNAFTNALNPVTTDGGTRQDLALEEFTSYNWPHTTGNSKKYIILITDGAPNGSIKEGDTNRRVDENDVKAALARLKVKFPDANLITVGLSMKDVITGQKLLYEIATVKDGKPYFYKAEDAEDLTYVLMDILKEVTAKATVQGTVKDPIDPAFYPVDENGNPLEAGTLIGLDGNVTTSDKPHGVLTNNNGVWSVEWTNQDFTWTGWKGSIYVKAKEDFLGGNTISTNGEASFTAEKYVVEDSTTTVILDEPKKYDLGTPYVNVHSLSFDEKNTEWKVYLDTSVSPESQMEALFNSVKVNEVVSETGEDHRRTKDSKLITQEGFTAETFLLKSVLPELSQDQWNTLKSGAELTLDYTGYQSSRYGDGTNAGTIVIRMVKEGEASDYDPHPAAAKAETYTLRVEYRPTAAADIDYHTTPSGSEGLHAGVISSENTHKISAFVRDLVITKTDMDWKPIPGTDEKSKAAFTLYRAAKTGETGKKVDGLPDGSYVEIKTVQTDGNGIASFGTLQRFSQTISENVYYLKETMAPEGFAVLPAPLKLTLSMKDQYKAAGEKAYSETKPASGPYDWKEDDNCQWVMSAVNNDGAVASYFKPTGGNGNDASGAAPVESAADTDSYTIKNNPGVELPYTGGIGTKLYTACGAMLLVLSALMYGFSRRRGERRFE